VKSKIVRIRFVDGKYESKLEEGDEEGDEITTVKLIFEFEKKKQIQLVKI
jgi:putative salt-induced outer membrane protein YdiY